MTADRVKRPASQWYWGDWLRDPALRSCSICARGLWIDMLALMHEGTPYGYLRVGSVAITAEKLARMVGEPVARVRAWLAELEAADVFSRGGDGAVYSRRMVRDEEVRNARAKGGAESSKNPNVPRAKGRGEGRTQGYPSPPSSEGSPSSASAASPSGTTPPPPLRARETSEAYRTVCALLPAAYRADFDALLDLVPEGEAWCREVRGYLEGMGRQAVTPEQVGVGVRHYVAAGKAADAKPRQLWRYVTGAKDDDPPPGAPANGAHRRSEKKPPQQFDYTPTKKDEDPKWQN
jgi:hypothetical protein